MSKNDENVFNLDDFVQELIGQTVMIDATWKLDAFRVGRVDLIESHLILLKTGKLLVTFTSQLILLN